jgi:hypothetical protein
MIRHRVRASQSGLGSGIIVALLVIALPLAVMPGVARADIGDEPTSSGKGSKPSIDQLSDQDTPKEPSLLTKPSDTTVTKQKAAAPPPSGPPLYQRWEFWAIAGGVVVATVLAVIAGQRIAHQINGGDVRECNMSWINCYGEGQ